MNIEKAKQIPMELLLQKMNCTPSKTSGFDVWYLSPLHDEKTASFKINTKYNIWFDFGLFKGGNIIDFVSVKFNYTIPEVLIFLENYSDKSIFSFQQQKTFDCYNNVIDNQIVKNKIILVKQIQHPGLKEYLTVRGILQYENISNLREVHYEANGKFFFSIGLLNISGGYEIRNKYIKMCIGKKDITLINNQSNVLIVFEGMFDYLSFLQAHVNLLKNEFDYLILNSVALISRCGEILKRYKKVEIMLDNDSTGDMYTEMLKSKYLNVIDMRNSFFGYKDLNECLVNGNLKV